MRLLCSWHWLPWPLGLRSRPLIEEGFNHFYNLEYRPRPSPLFEKASHSIPDCPTCTITWRKSLIFREMFRNGALESELVSGNNSFLRRPKLNPSPETEKRILDEIAKAMALGEARLKQNPNDTGAHVRPGDLLWAALQLLLGGEESLARLAQGRDRRAARLHNRISELEPDNVDARLVQGLHDYIVGSLPWGLRMLGFLVGIHGDKEKGIRTVQDVAQHGVSNRWTRRCSCALCIAGRIETQRPFRWYRS